MSFCWCWCCLFRVCFATSLFSITRTSHSHRIRIQSGSFGLIFSSVASERSCADKTYGENKMLKRPLEARRAICRRIPLATANRRWQPNARTRADWGQIWRNRKEEKWIKRRKKKNSRKSVHRNKMFFARTTSVPWFQFFLLQFCPFFVLVVV